MGKCHKDDEKSQHDRPSAAHLARSHICQLKLVLVNTPSEATVKLFHPTTECALRERGTAWEAMHGTRHETVSRYTLKTSDLGVTVEMSGQPKGGQVLVLDILEEKKCRS